MKLWSWRWWSGLFRPRQPAAPADPRVEQALESTVEPRVAPPVEAHTEPPEEPAVEATAEAAPEAAAEAAVEAAAEAQEPEPVATLPALRQPMDEWLRERALYFAPPPRSAAAFRPDRLLSPDLAFRLGPAGRIAIAPATAPPQPAIAAPESTLLEDFVTAPPGTKAKSDPAGRVLNVDPLALMLFLSNRENGPSEFLTEPTLLTGALSLRDQLIEQWRAARPPVSAQRLFDDAYQITHHAGTALLLCHNVSKAFARGGDALAWRIVDRAHGIYFDGQAHVALPTRPHSPLAAPSIFHQIFSAAEFGAADSGDWYRFFAAAAAAYYCAAGQTRAVSTPASESQAAWANNVSEVAAGFADSGRGRSPAYRAWLWTNAWTALEYATYGRGAAMHDRSLASMRGALFGISEAGGSPDAEWREWDGRIDAHMRLSPSTIASILAMPSRYVAGGGFTFVATVEEGLACRFASADSSDESLTTLAPRIVDEIGFKTIECSARRQVVVRCTSRTHCHIDRGDGFQDLAIGEA
jgi:hypothetical protein